MPRAALAATFLAAEPTSLTTPPRPPRCVFRVIPSAATPPWVAAGGAGTTGGAGGSASGGAAYFDAMAVPRHRVSGRYLQRQHRPGWNGRSRRTGGSNGSGGIASGGGVYIANISTSIASLTQDTITGNQSLGATGASTEQWQCILWRWRFFEWKRPGSDQQHHGLQQFLAGGSRRRRRERRRRGRWNRRRR